MTADIVTTDLLKIKIVFAFKQVILHGSKPEHENVDIHNLW